MSTANRKSLFYKPRTSCSKEPSINTFTKYHYIVDLSWKCKHLLASGIARTSPLLGHSMGTLHLYELGREVQKLLGRSGGILPPKIWEFYGLPGRFWGHTVAKRKLLTADSHMRLVIRYCAVQFQDRLATDSRSTTLLSALHWWGTASSC